MIQFYFLSIILNALAGFVLAADRDKQPGNETFRLVLGVLAALIGLLKLLSPTDIPVVGDLFPALAGIASGFALIFEYFKSQSTVENETTDRIDAVIRKNSRLLGFAAMGSAVLHFLLPRVLFL